MNRLSLVVGVLAISGVLYSGCSSSSGSGGVLPLSESQNAQASASQAQTSTAVGYLALQASLNDYDSANFAAVQTPIVVTSPSAGTVSIDFGAGTVINNTTISGVVTSTYVVSVNTMTVTVTYANISISTLPAGVIVTTGSLTLTADVTTPAAVTGSVTGIVTVVTGLDATTVDLNLTHATDGTTGTIVVDGSADVTSTRYGIWRADFFGVTASIAASARQITAGTIDMVNLLIPLQSVDMTFTGINTGTLIVSPAGTVEVFVL